jgi:hypothetical protein
MRRVLRPGGLLIISSVHDAHEYDQTKLPAGPVCVLADTFKHSLQTVYDELSASAFVMDAGHLIASDGSTYPLPRKERRADSRSPVGWISSWRKADRRAFSNENRK